MRFGFIAKAYIIYPSTTYDHEQAIMTESSLKEKYELELAIDAISELEAIKRLSRIFGAEVANSISTANLSKRGGLFFIRYRFTTDQLSDKNYERLSKSNKIFVLSDNLAIIRAKELLEYCLPVEVQLKKLLTYVYPSILEVFDGKTDKKSRIKLCKQINSWGLGDLLERLEFDLSSKRRDELLNDGGCSLVAVLESSATFDDFKNAILPQIKPNIVWDQVRIVLVNPIDYSDIKDQLHTLRHLRNKAAHPQSILDSEVAIAKEYSEDILKQIQDVKGNYEKELSESIQTLGKIMSELALTYTTEMQKIVNEYMCAMPNLCKSIKELTDSANSASLVSTFKNTDWLAIDSEMRKADPGLKEVMERFDNNDANAVLGDMRKELEEKVDRRMDKS